MLPVDILPLVIFKVAAVMLPASVTTFVEALLLMVSVLNVVAPVRVTSVLPSNWIALVPAVKTPLLFQLP